MTIKDRIYGKIEITEKVIQDLILSKPMQRLKKIGQDGATHFLQPKRNVTRFEHSVGVWYLSYLFKRPIEEQIACLLHDVPHTAFSHVIDFVFQNEKHNFHERFTEKIIMNSDIPSILKKYSINLKKVLNTEKFVLLENDLPDISFDRWDYFMRDGYMMNYIPKVLIEEFIKGMFVKNKKIYFKDIKLASTFAILFPNFSRLIWLDPESQASYYMLANILKIAISEHVITEEDFFSNDELLMNKLKNSKNKRIASQLMELKIGRQFIYTDKKDADFYGPNKPRFVDPWVKNDSKLVLLSSLVYSLNYYFEEFKERYKEFGVKERIIL